MRFGKRLPCRMRGESWGCGNGGLEWNEVRPRIEAALAEVPEVEALIYEPGGAPPATEMPI